MHYNRLKSTPKDFIIYFGDKESVSEEKCHVVEFITKQWKDINTSVRLFTRILFLVDIKINRLNENK